MFGVYLKRADSTCLCPPPLPIINLLLIWATMKQQLFLIFCVLFLEQGMGMKRPAEEDYNSNVHAKRSRDENGDGGPQLTLRFLLQSKVRFDVCPMLVLKLEKLQK